MPEALEKPQQSTSLSAPVPQEAQASLVSIALGSDSYWQRFRKCIRWQMGEYVKRDFVYSILGALLLGLFTLLEGSATLSTFYWGVLGFLVTFVVRVFQHTITTPALMDLALKQQLNENEQRINQLTEHKLTFEMDLRNTNIRVEESTPQDESHSIRIMASIQLRFENNDVHPTSMKELDITLHRLALVDGLPRAEIFTFLAILRISSNGIQIDKKDFEGMMIQEKRLTPFYLIEADCYRRR
jgi:hypothetical protein